MVCTRKKGDTEDSWRWADGVVTILECKLGLVVLIEGCNKFGLNNPVTQNSFGAESDCDQVGFTASGDSNLVSSCNLVCNNDNGYYSLASTSAFFECKEEKNFELNTYFECDQGCRIEGKNVESRFGNYVVKCNSPLAENWYNICNVRCHEESSVLEMGRFGFSDYVMCRMGRWNFDNIRLKCG
ncbi:hypothetical protein MHBO_001033 [Bonamia ostreae]|uniref:Uncharacterized protein n=1 Tax=Bonamia ostreae TaxID=126728 RepID=A0ABV2AHM5_9EUKA